MATAEAEYGWRTFELRPDGRRVEFARARERNRARSNGWAAARVSGSAWSETEEPGGVVRFQHSLNGEYEFAD